MPRERRWTDEQLAAAVAASRNLREVHLKLGLVPGDYALLRDHISRLGLDATHLSVRPGTGPRPRRTWTDAQLTEIVRTETTLSGVLRKLGYTPNGGMHRFISGRIRLLGLDTSHFTGKSWARGRTTAVRPAAPLSEVLVENSTYNTSRLRTRLIGEGLKPDHCEACGLHQWNGRPIPLELDHINGQHTDNRLESVSCVPTATRSRRRGARGAGRRSPIGSRRNF